MEPTKVILLSIDSLRNDRFTPAYFPDCWDWFDSRFVRFERAISAGVATPFAMPAILTGHVPKRDGTIDSDRSVAHAFDHAAALTNNPHLGPERGYKAGFDRFSTGPPSAERTIEETMFWATREIDGPGLYWIHVMEPHYPWDVSDDLNERFIDGTATPDDCKQLRDAYAESIRTTDRWLADLFGAFRFADWWDESMVIVVADHGEAFGEDGIYNHAWDARPIDELVHVPLAVAMPGHASGTVDHLVGTEQVARTIRQRSIDPLHVEPKTVRSYSNRWTRVTTPEEVRYTEASPFDMDELAVDDPGVLDRLKALGYAAE